MVVEMAAADMAVARVEARAVTAMPTAANFSLHVRRVKAAGAQVRAWAAAWANPQVLPMSHALPAHLPVSLIRCVPALT
jgi:hypothetical protein